MRRKIFTLFLLFFLLVNVFPFGVVFAKPQWLKEGLTATYRFMASSIVTRVIAILPNHGAAVEALPNCNGTCSWSVKSISGSWAEVNVDLDFISSDYTDQGKVTFPVNKTSSVRIDVDNRDTMASNGTSLGKICYWIDPNVEKWDTVTIYRNPPYEINATVMNYLYNPVKTPAGEFDCWHLYVEGSKTIPDVGIVASRDLWYDKATGILVAAYDQYYDVVLMSMGVVNMHLEFFDFKAPSTFVLESLTSYSPSPLQFLKISDYIPYIIAVVAVAAILTAVYITKLRKKKTYTEQ
jgi:hypothetical protein